MAKRQDDLAAYYLSLLKQHKETALQVESQIQAVLAGSASGGPSALPQAQQESLNKALDYVRSLLSDTSGAEKTGQGATTSTPNPQQAAAQAATKTIANEGQPTGKTSVFGQMFNGQQQLTTAGQMALAQALGSKYMIGINSKVNVGGDNKALGALSSIIKPGLTAAQILTSLMFNQDQGTIQSIQRELVAAGYLDPLHTTNLQIGSLSSVNDPTLQALANLLEASANHNSPVQKILTTGQTSSQGKDFAKLWDSIVSGQPFTVTGQQTQVSSNESLADQLRKTATGESGGQGVLAGMAGQNPTEGQTNAFDTAAREFQQAHPAQVTTQYEPQPGLGISGFTRFPLEKSQSTVGGADQAAMDQFTYNWVLQNMGSDVAANGAANILQAFNQLLGISGGTGNAPSTAAGGAG